MHARSRAGAWASTMLVVVIASGCASTRAPRGWLPDAVGSAQQAYGGWFAARVGPRDSTREVGGELLAVQDDTVFVLTASGFEAIPASRIEAAQVASYDAQWGKLGTWWTVGTLSTITHGFVLILSAPVWTLTGSVATAVESRAPIVRRPARSWAELNAHARFPQGLPPGLQRGTMRLRPVPGVADSTTRGVVGQSEIAP